MRSTGSPGKWATEDFGAAKLLGLRQMYPERYQEVETVLSLSEWIGWIFTGRRAMEYSQACESQLYDISQRIGLRHCAAFTV